VSILLLAKVTLLFAAALAAAWFATRAAAATRHAILAGAQLAALVLPLLALLLPPLPLLPTRAPTVREIDLEVTAPATAIAPVRATPIAPRRDWLALLWLAGAAIVAGTKFVAYIRAFAIARRAQGLFSDEVTQPSAFGRRILLPTAARAWSGERLRIATLHEEAHVARHDTLIAMIGDAACALYWFHPLAWLVASRARLERERACDDRVLGAGVGAADYAAAMLDIARTMVRGAAMPIAEGSQVERRIRAILDPSTRRRSAHALAALAAIVLAAPLLAALNRAIARPHAIEPDLLGDAVASPFSERIAPPAPVTRVDANGADAAFIAFLTSSAARAPRASVDFVPERARWALTRVRNGAVVAPLIDSLRDPDWRIRAYAAWALGHSGDRRATAPLTALLDEPVWRVRAMAANALANLADPAAERAVLDRIGDDAWQVRVEVVRYLKTLGGHDAEIAAMRSDRHIAVRTAAE
jgi:beta-lactamase regulating signal transducer with metallopeptidase domain